MLDVFSYPVSFLLRLWHALFGVVFGAADVVGWILAIAFLVCTLRALLLRPALSQARFARAMRAVAPQLAELRQRYADDRERYAAELSKLLGEHRVNPAGAYLPVLLQLPVFLGLGQVLRALTSAPVGATYAFSAADVASFLDATLLGVHLGDAVVQVSAGGLALLWPALPVVAPLVLLAAAATYVTGRLAPATGTEARWMRAVRYLPPLAVLVFGAALPVGLLVYWVSNNLWTLGQQYVLLRRA